MPPSPAELRSSLPETLRRSPGFLLGKAAQHGIELVERALSQLDLKARHYGVLVALDQLGPQTQHRLGELLRIDRTTMVAVVDHLERLSFAERAVNPDDRRSHRVQLTRAGRAVLEQARVAAAEADAALVGQLTEKEREQLVRLLRKVCSLG